MSPDSCRKEAKEERFLYIMNFKGIDSLAGVILYSNMIKIGRLLLIIAPAFLFVIDGIKSLFNNREKSKR